MTLHKTNIRMSIDDFTIRYTSMEFYVNIGQLVNIGFLYERHLRFQNTKT